MAYLRIETSAPRHRKFLSAGPAACWLWVCGLAYCQDGLTDGFIPFEALDHLGVRGARGLKAKLIAAGLWAEVNGGWQMHDYLQWNKDANTIRAIQQERREAGALGGRRKQSAKQPPSKSEAPEQNTSNPSVTVAVTPAVAAAVTPPLPPVRLAPLHSNEHRTHAECGRVCLPAFLFSEFVRRRGGENPDRVIRDWAHQTLKAWADRPDEPGEPLAFWRSRYDEQWPAPVKVKPSRLPEWAR